MRIDYCLLIPAAAILMSCAGGPAVAPEVRLDTATTPQQLRDLLESIRERTDVEAMMGRARIYNRLRVMEKTVSPTLLAMGDSSDVEVLSHGGTPGAKAESAGRLSAHFRERAENPLLSRSSFPGHLGEPMRRIVLLTVAAFFGESASRREMAMSLEKLAAASMEFAEREALSPEAVKLWRKRAAAAYARVQELGSGSEPVDPSVDARNFCESEPTRHIEEGTRSADLGTREKASRSEMDMVVQWYMLALAHYAVVRETAVELTPAQEHALAGQEIIVRSLCDLICREP